MNVLVTGGAGYIGSHVIDDLIKSGYTPIVYDNFSTGHAEAVPETVQLIQGDLHDFTFLKHIMGQYEIDAVLHFAASSQVGESMVDPGNITITMWLVLWVFLTPCGKAASSISSFRRRRPFTGNRTRFLLRKTCPFIQRIPMAGQTHD